MEVQVFQNGELVRTLKDISGDFAFGYVYGVLTINEMGRKSDGENYMEDRDNFVRVFRFEGIRDERSADLYHDVSSLQRHGSLTPDNFGPQLEKFIISNKYTKHLAPPGKYFYWVVDSSWSDIAQGIIDNNLDVFHGLFNAAEHMKIPLNDIVLSKPVKDGQWYDIRGVTLQYPDEI